MKKFFINIMATTGTSLVILAILAMFFGNRVLSLIGILETFGVNIVICTGLHWLGKWESGHLLLEISVDVVYTIIVLLIFGAVFGWYSSTPPWVPVVMAVVVYLIGLSMNIYRTRRDVESINQLLKERKQKNTIVREDIE